MIKQTTLALAAIVAGVSSVQAQDALSVTVDVTYVTDCVFRGGQLAGGSIQPSIEATYGDFYAGAWHSNAISGTNNGFDSETDLYAGYGMALTDVFSVDGGVTRYTYSGGSGGDSTEVYVGISADVLLSPSVYYYHDFDYETNVIEVTIGHSIPVDAINASLDLSGTVGHFGQPGEDRTYYVAGASIPFALSETATLTVGVDYVINDGDRLFFNGKKDGVVGSAGISIGF